MAERLVLTSGGADAVPVILSVDEEDFAPGNLADSNTLHPLGQAHICKDEKSVSSGVMSRLDVGLG